MKEETITLIWQAYVNSPAAVWATLIGLFLLLVATKYGNEFIDFVKAVSSLIKAVSKKIKDLETIKHKDGELHIEAKGHPSNERYNLMVKEQEKLNDELKNAKNELSQIDRLEQSELIKIVNNLNQQNEDNKYRIAFERLDHYITNWQYKILQFGFTEESHVLKVSDVKNKLREAYTNYDEVITEEWFKNTLNGFITLNLIILSEDEETITFTDLSNSFVNYISFVYNK